MQVGGNGIRQETLVNGRHSDANPDGGPNGPGCSGLSVGSHKVEMTVGDVLIVPPGVVHGWSDIPDHVDYLSFQSGGKMTVPFEAFLIFSTNLRPDQLGDESPATGRRPVSRLVRAKSK